MKNADRKILLQELKSKKEVKKRTSIILDSEIYAQALVECEKHNVAFSSLVESLLNDFLKFDKKLY